MSNKAGAEHRATAESMFRAIDTSGNGRVGKNELVISLRTSDYAWNNTHRASLQMSAMLGQGMEQGPHTTAA